MAIFDPHINFGYSTVLTAPVPAASGTSLTLQAGAGALFPDPAGIGYEVTIWPAGALPLAANAEIARVTAKVGDVLTLVRAQAGTSARTIVAGDQINNPITRKVIEDIEAAIIGGGITNVRLSAGTLSALRSDLTFADSNGVSFGLQTDGVITGTVQTNYQSAGAYLTTAMQSNAVTLSNIKVSAGTLSALRSDLTFSNSNGVSFGLETNGVITGTVATNYQSQGAYLTTAMASNRGSDFVQAAAAFHGTNASGTIASDALSVSVAAQTVQTQNLHNVTLSGNTAGVLAAISSGTMTIAGGNNITVSQNGNAFTISGANVGGAQTGISGIVASDATYTSGTVQFTGVGGGVTVQSNTGQRVDISVAAPVAQSVQTQNLVAVSLSGNTAGVLALVSSGTVFLAGGNNVTLSQNGQSITISGANAGGVQTGISGIVVSDATYTSGTVSFSNAGNITIASSVDGATQYIRLSGHAAQTVQTQSLIAAVYDGAASISTGTIRFTNANGVTFTINGQTLSGSVATTYLGSNASTNYVQADAVFNGTNATGTIASNAISVSVAAPIPIATVVQPVASANSTGTVTRYAPEDHRHAGIGGVGISTAGNTAGTTGSVVGTYWFQGGNSITVSQITSNNGSHTLVISAGNYLTTAMASNRGSDFVQATAVFNGTNATGTIASGAISVSVAAPVPIGTNVKAVASIGSTGTITRYAPEDHQHRGVAAFAVTNTGNTLGDTRSQVGTFFLAASGGITASQSTGAAGNDTVWLSVAAPVAQSSMSVSDAATSGTLARLAFTNLNGVTLSLSTGAGGSHTIVGSHNALTSQSTQFMALTLGGNTAGTTTFHASNNASLFFHGGANITLSGNGSSVTISGASAAPSPVNFSAGTTSSDIGSVVFSDSHGVSFGLNGSTITASIVTHSTVGTATTVYSVASANSVGTVTRWAAEDHRHAGVGGIGISTSGNTAGTTGSVLGTYWFEGGNNITVSQITSNNGSHTLRLSVGGGAPEVDYYDNGPIGVTALSNPGQMTLYVFPFTPVNEVFPANMSVESVFLNVTQSVSTAATWTNQLSIAFYSSVNSTQLTRVVSGSTSWGTNAGNMNINDSFGGTRWLTIGSGNFNAQPVLLEGVRYWCAIWNRTSNNAGSMSLNLYGYQSLGNSNARSGILGAVSVVNSTLGWGRFMGIYSVTFSTAMPSALAASDINKSVAQVLFLPQVILNNVATNII